MLYLVIQLLVAQIALVLHGYTFYGALKENLIAMCVYMGVCIFSEIGILYNAYIFLIHVNSYFMDGLILSLVAVFLMAELIAIVYYYIEDIKAINNATTANNQDQQRSPPMYAV